MELHSIILANALKEAFIFLSCLDRLTGPNAIPIITNSILSSHFSWPIRNVVLLEETYSLDF